MFLVLLLNTSILFADKQSVESKEIPIDMVKKHSLKLENQSKYRIVPSMNKVVLFQDDFESGLGNWAFAPGDWATVTYSSHSPTTSVTESPGVNYSPDDLKPLVINQRFDFSAGGYTSISLSFYHADSTEAGWDFAYVEISTDSSTWTELGAYDGYSGWTHEIIDLSAYGAEDSVWIRFLFDSDGSVQYEGWYLDDVVVDGSLEDNVPPTITVLNAPSNQFDSAIDDTVLAEVTDNIGVDSAVVWYSLNDINGIYTPLMMTNTSGDSFFTAIPAQPQGTRIYWYIEANDTSGNGIIDPSGGVVYTYSILPTTDLCLSVEYTSQLNAYSNALNDLGIEFDLWIHGNAVDYSNWSKLLFGETGSISNQDETDLLAFQASGSGKLMITGDDIGYYENSNSTLWPMFHANYIEDDLSSSTDDDSISGIAGNTISDGYGPWVASADWPDGVSPTAGAQSFLTAHAANDPAYAAGISFMDAGFMLAYIPIEFDDFDSLAAQTDLLSRIINWFDTAVMPAPKLLISEIVVTPTSGEFVEIHNPNTFPVDLSDYYITDATYAGGGTYYYQIVEGGGGGGGFGDWHARFPDGAMIGPDEFQTVAFVGDSTFFVEYGVLPTYELFEDGYAVPSDVPDMREAFTGSINGQGGLTNGDEVVILYYWDGMSDLVEDVDYLLYNSGSPVANNEAVDKTGVSIDGPDAGTDPSTYLNDTPIANQVSAINHGYGFSVHRIDYAEGAQIASGGNGVSGADETSEDLNNTFTDYSVPSPNAAYTAPTFTVDGTVTLEDTTALLEGTIVTLATWVDTTDTNGYYQLAGVDTGTYNLNFSRTGYETLDTLIVVTSDITVDVLLNLQLIPEPDDDNEYAFISSPNGGVFRVDDNAALDVTGDFTVEAWVYINEDIASSRFIADRDLVWQFYIISASVRFDLQNTADLITTGVLSLNEWHHVAVIREGTDTKIYADGEKKASSTILAMSAGTTPVVIGGQDSWFSGARTSIIDEVKFSNAAIYDTSGFTPSTEAPLGFDANTVFYFQFEDTTEIPPLDNGPLSLSISNGQTDGTNLFEAGNYVDAPAGLPLHPDTSIIFSDNFDSYTAGTQLVVQNNVDWDTWSGGAGTSEDPNVSDAYAHSAPNSVVIVYDVDLIAPLGSQTSGVYSVSWQSYIPSGKSGYFGVLNRFYTGNEKGMRCFYNVDGTADFQFEYSGPVVTSFNYTQDAWQEVELVVDLDQDLAEFRYDGAVVYQWQWTRGTLSNQLDIVDFWGRVSTDEMYIDDYIFRIADPIIVDGIGDELSTLPTTFALEQNYPNPFNPTTTIKYQLPKQADVKIVIYNMLGQMVRTIVNKSENAGFYQVIWDGLNESGSRVATGIYFYRMEADKFVKSHKMIMMK
jgi:hypothetical protein